MTDILQLVLLHSRVPARIADRLVAISPSTGIAVVLILAMTGIISIFVENVATVLVMAPIALALSKKLKLNPVPFMIGLALMSNLEGTATLVGDPPSMIFASYAHYSFNDFFISQGKISIFQLQIRQERGCQHPRHQPHRRQHRLTYRLQLLRQPEDLPLRPGEEARPPGSRRRYDFRT